MTDDVLRLMGEVNGLRLALRMLVQSRLDPEVIDVLRRATLRVVEHTKDRPVPCRTGTIIDGAERETVEFIFAPLE